MTDANSIYNYIQKLLFRLKNIHILVSIYNWRLWNFSNNVKVRTRQQQARVDGGVPENDITSSFGGEIGKTMTESMLKRDGQVTVKDADGGMSVITVGEVGETVIVGGNVIHTIDANDVQGVVEQMASGIPVHNGFTTADGAEMVVE